MTGMRSVLVAALLAAAFSWCILRLLNLQDSAGAFYPEYSSLRADPRGARLLIDSLTRLPGFETSRNYLPLEYFNAKRATLLLLGLRLEDLNPGFLARVDKLAQPGNRILVALAFQEASRKADRSPIERAWKIRLSLNDQPNNRHPLFIADPGAWTVRERAGPEILAVERRRREGSVWLFAESREFSNESLVGGLLAPVAEALGPNTQVVFDEQHFGIAESGSVVGLARRFRLAGLAFGLVIVAALALWKNAAAFPPLRQTAPLDHQTGRTSFEGLVTLLQRHIRPQQLVAACWEEWLKANRHRASPDRLRQTEAIAAAGASHPLETVREMQAGLRAKGDL